MAVKIGPSGYFGADQADAKSIIGIIDSYIHMSEIKMRRFEFGQWMQDYLYNPKFGNVVAFYEDAEKIELSPLLKSELQYRSLMKK